MEQWYTLYTKPNSEYRVASALQQHQIEVYLPETYHRHKTTPFFPCYLFMRIDLEKVNPSQWQWTSGLLRVIAFGGKPVPLSDEMINFIRHSVEKARTAGWHTHGFKPGDTVRIKEGPLEGMLAIFDGPTRPNQRVQVLLAILGRASRVRIDAAELEKVPSTVETPPLSRLRRTRGRGRRVRQNTL